MLSNLTYWLFPNQYKKGPSQLYCHGLEPFLHSGFQLYFIVTCTSILHRLKLRMIEVVPKRTHNTDVTLNLSFDKKLWQVCFNIFHNSHADSVYQQNDTCQKVSISYICHVCFMLIFYKSRKKFFSCIH